MLHISKYNDDELIVELRKDNESAFNEIYNRYWKSLYTKAYNFLSSESDAKDCVQNVFISLWKNRETSIPQNLNHYLHQSIRFQVFKLFTKRRTTIGLDEKIAEFTQIILQENNIQYKELAAALRRIISKLPKENQEIFIMNREMGLTYKDIAKRKNISIKTVEKKMSQALRELRENWSSTFMALVILHYIK